MMLGRGPRAWRRQTTIDHTNDLTLTGDGEETVVTVHVPITEIGPKARMADFGMEWG